MKYSAIVAGLLAGSLVPLSAAPAWGFAAVLNPDAAQSQNIAGFGPLDPSPPSGITVDEIIQKFGARESEFSRARDN